MFSRRAKNKQKEVESTVIFITCKIKVLFLFFFFSLSGIIPLCTGPQESESERRDIFAARSRGAL